MFLKKTEAARKVFGFPCSQNLSSLMRDLHTLLDCPIYCVSEHSLEIGAVSILTAYEDKELREALKDHLTREHLLKQELYLSNEYDVLAVQEALKKEVARMEHDKLAHELVNMIEKENIPIKLLVEIAKQLIKDARQRPSRTTYGERRR